MVNTVFHYKCMNFVAVMLCTQEVFYLECLLFWIKSQLSVAYKSVIYKKKHLTSFFSLLKMKK